jgi:hypothetical protein
MAKVPGKPVGDPVVSELVRSLAEVVGEPVGALVAREIGWQGAGPLLIEVGVALANRRSESAITRRSDSWEASHGE